ncbi:MAG: DNA pilot protein [Microviridae sp.]|nr:MAG: DNA pilot protein [Microviridae sp.]
MDASTVGLIGAGLGLLGGSSANDAAMNRQGDANAFSAQQFATRYQTTVADLKAAGLNPMLAYTQGGGSPPSSAQPAPVTNSLRDAADVGTRAYSAARHAELQGAQTSNTDADTLNKRADTILKRDYMPAVLASSAGANQATIANLENVSRKITEEIKNIPKEGDRLDKMVTMLSQQAALMQSQRFSQAAIKANLEALTVKVGKESQMLQYDIDAVIESGNFGKEFGQYKQVLDVISNVFRAIQGRR